MTESGTQDKKQEAPDENILVRIDYLKEQKIRLESKLQEIMKEIKNENN